MADEISTASGVLTSIAFAHTSSKSLHDLLSDIQNSPRSILQLRGELSDLCGVLLSLKQKVIHENLEFGLLKIPLLLCGNACLEFQAIVAKLGQGNSKRAKAKDWMLVRYMGEDIIGFKNMLASYKSTISIAIGDANL
jgi:hypothetical protein